MRTGSERLTALASRRPRGSLASDVFFPKVEDPERVPLWESGPWVLRMVLGELSDVVRVAAIEHERIPRPQEVRRAFAIFFRAVSGSLPADWQGLRRISEFGNDYVDACWWAHVLEMRTVVQIQAPREASDEKCFAYYAAQLFARRACSRHRDEHPAGFLAEPPSCDRRSSERWKLRQSQLRRRKSLPAGRRRRHLSKRERRVERIRVAETARQRQEQEIRMERKVVVLPVGAPF